MHVFLFNRNKYVLTRSPRRSSFNTVHREEETLKQQENVPFHRTKNTEH